jgi:hypothetical protein
MYNVLATIRTFQQTSYDFKPNPEVMQVTAWRNEAW